MSAPVGENPDPSSPVELEDGCIGEHSPAENPVCEQLDDPEPRTPRSGSSRRFDPVEAARDARGDDPLSTVIGQLVGFGSRCWDQDGVFMSEQAAAAVARTVEWLRARDMIRGDVHVHGAEAASAAFAVLDQAAGDRLLVVTPRDLSLEDAVELRDDLQGALRDPAKLVSVLQASSVVVIKGDRPQIAERRTEVSGD